MMTLRKIKYMFFLLLMMAGFRVSAQNVDSLLFVGDSLRSLYRFEESLLFYEDALDLALADTLATADHIRERISCSENGRNLMALTDTPVVEAKHRFSLKDFYLYYPLPDKSWRRTPNQLDTLGGRFSQAVYYPEGASQIYYSSADTTSVRSIRVTRDLDTLWTTPALLGGASFSVSNEIYPMLSPDGKSLYFSSNGLYGVGGYDIYVSKWDDAKEEWGSPMNVGFPYSSPADDFLYTTSEDGRYTVFASNRGCSADSVWVYVLKYQDVPVRKEVTDPSELKKIADLDPVGYEERIENNSQVEADIPENLDTKKYLDKITEVRVLQDTINVYNERLEKDRNEYALSTDEDERMELTTKILQQEALIPEIQQQLDKAKSQLHKIEMEFLFSGVVIDPDKLLAQADREVVGEATSYTFTKNSFGSAFELKLENKKEQ